MSANAPLPGAFDVFARAHAQRPERPKRPETGGPASHATLRDYFAARAPAVPPWFRWADLPPGLTITEALKRQPGYSALTLDDIELLRQSDVDGDLQLECLPLRLHEIATAANQDAAASWRARSKAEAAGPQERFFRWRWYYADQMLAGRSA